ncbi:hypothetical protein GCM10009865_01000 [Aeromicrobium ponti]|uniref:Uncharacterized protein n=1 Tax=Cytobacillus oceanisediminis TaxID=665099 RepID=A0A562K5S6_9BACI|nr:hypothetical protein IQ19_00008 [Cytobacillus oceanisediminis]
MCFCHEFNKKIAPKGLYHGRVLPATKGNNTILKSSKVYKVPSLHTKKIKKNN